MRMNSLRVVFMGTPVFAVNILEGLIENYDVVGVVSQPDRKVGRKQVLVNTPVKECALKHGVLVFQPSNIKEDYKDILDLKPDVIVTCAYGQIIPKEILSYPRLGCINVHASLLPKLRGGAPIHRAIIEGYKKTGITIMYMDEKMDTGDIISARELDILDNDNLETLQNKLSKLGKELLLDTLPSVIAGTNERIKQNNDEATYAYNIKSEEEHLDLSKSSREVYDHIRGLSPEPGAYLLLDDQVFKVYNATITDKKFNDKKIGEVVGLYKNGIGVMTSTGEIVLTDIKPFGKKRMDARSYINGIHDNNLIGKVLK